jgi:hypothetical protein
MVQCRHRQRDKTVLNEVPRTEDVCGSEWLDAVIPNLESRWNRMATFTSWSPYPTKEGPLVPSGYEDVTSEARVRSQARLYGGFLTDLVALVKVKVKAKVKFTLKQDTKAPRG